MNEGLLAQLSSDLARGNGALWLGPNWKSPGTAELEPLLSYPWLAVWTEVTDSHFASELNGHWAKADADGLLSRVVHEVPDRLEDALGTYYSFTEVCPIFYLNGRENSWESLARGEQRRARDEKVDELMRLQDSLLLVDGFTEADALCARLEDEFHTGADSVQVLLCNVTDSIARKVFETIGRETPGMMARLRFISVPLVELLRRVQIRQREKPPEEPSIRVGTKYVRLAPLLVRDPPVDECFEILTADVVQIALDEEDKNKLREDLLRGRGAPFRAFSHELQWKRSAIDVKSVAQRALRDLGREGAPLVECVSFFGERGSGLTTTLQEIAFETARSGSPTLFHRPEIRNIDYEALRELLEQIDELASERRTPVLVFDGGYSTPDPVLGFRDLPARLARDGRRALVIRGVSIRSASSIDVHLKSQLAVKQLKEKVEEYWLDTTLLANVNDAERGTLCDWATESWKDVPAAKLRLLLDEWGADWESDEKEAPPLLICLYFILKGHVSASTELGHHLVQRLHALLSEAQDNEEADEASTNRALDDREILEAIELLKLRFESDNSDAISDEQAAVNPFGLMPSRDKMADIVSVLAALGTLRAPIPRRVLTQIMSLEVNRLNSALLELERVDLVSIDLVKERGFKAPKAFYGLDEMVGLRHPAYGRLILDWLTTEKASEDRLLFQNAAISEEILARVQSIGLQLYPISLLEPILKRIRPTASEVLFIEELATRFLRLQKIKGSSYHRWVFSKDRSEEVLRLFDSIAEQVVRQSSVILHSRGITRYKSCQWVSSIEECRTRYQLASQDFDLALERVEFEYGKEQPENIMTSKGLMYMFWANQERERSDGSREFARKADGQAIEWLRNAVSCRRDNPYAAYGLAEFLVSRCERTEMEEVERPLSDGEKKEYADDLSEACELLQRDPSDSFRAEWEALWERARKLLDSDAAKARIRELKSKGLEIGFALDAMRALNGRIPIDVTTDPGEVEEIENASRILEDAIRKATTKSLLADFLRYVLLSCHPDRNTDPAFEQRFRMLSDLKDSSYLQQPTWLFDYGMLALQTRHIRIGLDAFRELRRGRKFLEVPLERATRLVDSDQPSRLQQVVLRIIRLDVSGLGWGRIDRPAGFDDAVPFSMADLKKSKGRIEPGRTVTCHLRIRPSGLFAEAAGRHE